MMKLDAGLITGRMKVHAQFAKYGINLAKLTLHGHVSACGSVLWDPQ